MGVGNIFFDTFVGVCENGLPEENSDFFKPFRLVGALEVAESCTNFIGDAVGTAESKMVGVVALIDSVEVALLSK